MEQWLGLEAPPTLWYYDSKYLFPHQPLKNCCNIYHSTGLHQDRWDHRIHHSLFIWGQIFCINCCSTLIFFCRKYMLPQSLYNPSLCPSLWSPCFLSNCIRAPTSIREQLLQIPILLRQREEVQKSHSFGVCPHPLGYCIYTVTSAWEPTTGPDVRLPHCILQGYFKWHIKLTVDLPIVYYYFCRT